MQQSTLHKKIVIRSVLPYTVIHSVGKQTLPVNLMQENFSNFMIFCDDAISMTTAREPGGRRKKKIIITIYSKIFTWKWNMYIQILKRKRDSNIPSMFMNVINCSKHVINNFNSAGHWIILVIEWSCLWNA